MTEITFFSFVEQRLRWLQNRGLDTSDTLELKGLLEHPDYVKSASRWPHVLAAIDDVRKSIGGGPVKNWRPRLLVNKQQQAYQAWRAQQWAERRADKAARSVAYAARKVEWAERRAERERRKAERAERKAHGVSIVEWQESLVAEKQQAEVNEKILSPFDPPS